jgi:hypothetical protein
VKLEHREQQRGGSIRLHKGHKRTTTAQTELVSDRTSFGSIIAKTLRSINSKRDAARWFGADRYILRGVYFAGGAAQQTLRLDIPLADLLA